MRDRVDGAQRSRIYAIFTNSCPKIEHRDSRESCQAEPDVCADAAACSSSTRRCAVRLAHSVARTWGIVQISWNFDFATRSGLINVLLYRQKCQSNFYRDRFDTYPFRIVKDNYDDKYFKKRNYAFYIRISYDRLSFSSFFNFSRLMVQDLFFIY